MLSRRFGDALQELNHHLVVPVEEIDFESFDPHFRIVLENLLIVIGHRGIASPKDQPHVSFRPIPGKLFHVNLRDHRHRVVFLPVIPTGVHQDVFESEFRREIYEVLVGDSVDS